MNGQFKLSKIAVILAGCSLVVSCGGEESNTTKSDLYDYSKQSICVDTDRNYACAAGEQKVSTLWSVASDNTAPFLIETGGYVLTAPASANVVSPFTTLIQNEILFNPQFSGSVAQVQTQVQSYLQQLFGDQYSIDFNRLNTEHGPKEATNLLLASFAHALSLKGESRALKISAAVDKMVSSGSFDITKSLKQTDLDNSYVNLNKRYLIPGSYPMRTLSTSSAITINENTGMLLALTYDNKLLQIDTATGLNNIFTPATTTQAAPTMSTYDDHDDDDDDDDHDGDDCDDDYGSLFGDDCNGSGTTQPASRILSATQGEHNKNAYLIYQPTIHGDNSMSYTCNSTGNNGIFLTELGKNSQASPLSSAPKISTYSRASGGSKPPVVVPVLPVSSASCKNNHISELIVSLNHNTAVAVFNKGYGQGAELKQLSSDTLQATGNSYDLSSAQPALILSKQQKSLFVLQNSGTPAVVINAQTLNLQSEIIKNDIDNAAFVNNDKQLIVSDKTNTLRWIDIAQGSSIATLVLAENVLKLTSDPTGKLSAALTNKNIYLIDNETKSIIYSQAYTQGNAYGMSMLSNRIIISRSGAIDYIQFDNLTGSPIKIAKQMLSKDLLTNWSKKSGASLTDMTLAELLKDIGEDDIISQQFNDIDLQWRPASTTNIESVKEVIITGEYRGQRISVSKML
jgi:hypothetical protein